MHVIKISSISVLSALLVACNTTVVTDEERELPEVVEPPAAEETVTEPEAPAEPEAPSQPTAQSADLSQSCVSFIGKKGEAVSHEGKFEKFDYMIKKAEGAEDYAGASMSLDIEIDSMVTDSEGLTGHLKSPDFFDVATHPSARFASSSVTKNEDGSYAVSGDLTIKGVTQELSFTATITDQYITASLAIDRTAFGVGGPAEGVKAIDAEVPVEVKIVFK